MSAGAKALFFPDKFLSHFGYILSNNYEKKALFNRFLQKTNQPRLLTNNHKTENQFKV